MLIRSPLSKIAIKEKIGEYSISFKGVCNREGGLYATKTGSYLLPHILFSKHCNVKEKNMQPSYKTNKLLMYCGALKKIIRSKIV